MTENVLFIRSNDKSIGYLCADVDSVQVTILDMEYLAELYELARALRMNPLPYHAGGKAQFLRPGHSDYYLAVITRLSRLSWKGYRISGTIEQRPGDSK